MENLPEPDLPDADAGGQIQNRQIRGDIPVDEAQKLRNARIRKLPKPRMKLLLTDAFAEKQPKQIFHQKTGGTGGMVPQRGNPAKSGQIEIRMVRTQKRSVETLKRIPCGDIVGEHMENVVSDSSFPRNQTEIMRLVLRHDDAVAAGKNPFLSSGPETQKSRIHKESEVVVDSPFGDLPGREIVPEGHFQNRQGEVAAETDHLFRRSGREFLFQGNFPFINRENSSKVSFF